MRKVIVLVLALILLMGMAAPAYAAETTAAEEAQKFLVSSTAKESECFFLAESMAPEYLESLKEAIDAEDEIAGDGIVKYYMFYLSLSEPATVEFWVPDVRNVIVKQFVDDEWVLRQYTRNQDDTITVKNAVSSPTIIYTVKGVGSPTAKWESDTATALLPVFVSATSDDCNLCSVLDDYKLTAETRQDFADAQDALKDAVPAGMVARYFFYVCTSETCTMVLKIGNFTELTIKQYQEGQWVELKHTVNSDGTISIENVVESPMAIFTK